jgi:phosphate transport system substrate-binding protein
MVGPTIGSLDIMADESMKDIIQQEEEIFERTYKYANVNISYLNEYDMFRQFFTDSTDAIFTTRALTKEETKSFDQHNIHPRQFAFAKGAIAFVVNKNQKDTTYTYEEILSLLKDPSKGEVFIIENAKSGISNVVMELIHASALPSHFFALGSKKEVFDYVITHDNAIGLVDWSDLSDSDNPETKKILNTIILLGISRSSDSTQPDFVKPYQYNLQDDVYPFTRGLYFISKTGMTDVGIGFASFISGEIGQKIILKAGLLPLFQPERVLELQNISDIKVVK